MSNVPESASYDSGIYQLETVDEVLGGVNGKANAQAKGLANRTAWLKAQVDALNLLKGKGGASFSIANSYVAGEIVDYQKNIYRANTTVTPGAWNASQWNKLLGTAAESELASAAPLMNGAPAVGTSTLLARQDHVHPADTGREAAIAAGTTAQFWRGDKTWQDFAAAVRGSALTGLSTVTSTVVAAADTILVAIGKLQAQITLQAPLADPTFTGVPAAPTPANGTNTTQLATTAFVQSQIASSVPAASETVAGKVELATAAETTAGTDNTRAVHPAGLKVELDKKAPLASPALTGTPTAPTAATGTRSTAIATMQNFANEFGSSLAANGYQKLPSGLIIQWGTTAGSANSTDYKSFPVAFPNACLQGVSSYSSYPLWGQGCGFAPVNASQFIVTGYTSSGASSSASVRWIAIGY